MKIFLAIILSLATSAFAQNAKHPFTFEDMMALKRVGAPVPSPDGKWVVFDCEDVDLNANTKISHLWIVPASGGESRRLNPTPNHEERPRFSPDGKRLIWTSKATDPTQIWMCDFDSGSGVLVGKPHQVTSLSTGADGGIWSPDGKNIVFVSAVYPDCNPPPPGSGATSDDCNKQRDEELKKSKVKAKIFSRLFYRHWNAFTEFKRSHLFVVPADAVGDAVSVPGKPYSSTRQSGKIKNLSENFDRSIGSFCWGTLWRNAIIWLTYDDRGQSFIAGVEPQHESTVSPMPAWPRGDTHADNVAVIDRTIFYSQQFATAPDEIWHLTLSINHDTTAGAEPPAPVTHMNDALLSHIDMQPLESFGFKGWNDEDVQGFMIKPPGFDPNKKYPLKFLIHGGPQGAWGNSWTYRWNAELFSATGNYVVVMINFHGSTGYGQKFTDSISGDWGRQTVCRSDEGARLHGEDISVHRQKPRGSARRELRRLHG